jgi:hypothetical protein
MVKPRDRLRRHVRDALTYGVDTHSARWIRTLDAEPTLVVLEECAREAVEEAERRWIADMREAGCRLTNHTDGGDGMLGKSPSAETRAKIGAAHRGKVVSTETRARMSAAARARRKKPVRVPLSAEELQLSRSESMKRLWATRREEMLSYSAKGKEARQVASHTPEARAKRGEAMRRRWADPGERARLSKAISHAKKGVKRCPS